MTTINAFPNTQQNSSTPEFYETYKASVIALAETWVLEGIVEQCKKQPLPEEGAVAFEWDPSDAFFLDAQDGAVVIVQKDDETSAPIEFRFSPKTKVVTERPYQEAHLSSNNLFNVGRAVRTKTFRDYMIRRINDLNLNTFMSVENDANHLTVSPKRYGRASSSAASAPRELPKICDYITTKSAVKMLKTKMQNTSPK